ncbi:hypothetical protein [Paraburkholderia tropica]|uniref:hypothetical protein n=1 Tax=Paraburkholderia tropica TaxID=92647 RepID=UPI002AB0DAE8|nr:hypothetical protein [Paraburkholderia tropica]
MNPEYLAGMDKAARDRKTASLMKSFHHSLWLYKRYPKGHPHSYSARAALAKIKAGGQTALCDLSKPRPVAKWARDDIDPATALEMLRAMHKRQKDE